MAKSATIQSANSSPAGTGNVGGLGESFSLDLNSGQSNFSVPFDLPSGVAGFKPNLKLEYAHGQGNGSFGLGWRLPLRQIDRRLDYGVPEPNLTTAQIFLDSGTELRLMADGQFHPLRETGFSRYERIGDHWLITERDGSRCLLGLSSNARVADPNHPERIQSWLLERQEDMHGNGIDYIYARQDGYPYLAEIRYARFRVRLIYEARPDKLRNGRAGFVRGIAQRCQSISLHLAADDREVRRLTLGYTTAMGSGVSLLTTLQLSGFAPGEAPVHKNPLQLSYHQFDPHAAHVAWVDAAVGDPSPQPLSDPDATMISLDNLPLPGVLENRGGRLYYWPNNGRGGWGAARPLPATPQATSFAGDGVQFLDIDGNGSADMLVGVGLTPLQGFYPNSGTTGFGDFVAYPRGAPHRPPFELGRTRLADLDGDGVIDAALSTAHGLVTYRNRGRSGWQEPVVNPRAREIDFADANTFFADMTGDGLPDLVQVRSGRVEYRMNLGHGRFSDPIRMGGSPRLTKRVANDEQILLADIDGDGCCDLIRLLPHRIELYLNRSGQDFAPPVVVDVIPSPLAGTATVVDFNGSGSAGLLYNSLRQGRVGYVHTGWKRAALPASGINGATACSVAKRLRKRSSMPKITEGRSSVSSSAAWRSTVSPSVLLRR